jgi:hypothetical protein
MNLLSTLSAYPPQEIAQPVDLQTIERSLGRGRVSKYLSVEEFVSEVDLMFVNALKFNHHGSELHADAALLRREAIQVSSVGDAKSSLGDAKSSLGDAES